MTLDELAQSISKQGLLPVPVEGDVDKEEARSPIFAGALDDYLRISKELGAKGILIYSKKLADTDFIYEPDEDELLDQDELSENHESPDGANYIEPTHIDLTIALPDLAGLKSRLGVYCAFLLSAVGGSTELDFYLEETWWKEFSELRERAIEKVHQNREAYIEKMKRKRAEREKELRKQLRQLIHDDEFVRIPTQRGMKAYALEKCPELEQLTDSSLTEEVQALWDKIRAKGLHKRRR